MHGEFAAHSSADVSELLAERFAQPGLRGRSSRLLDSTPQWRRMSYAVVQ